MLIQTHTENLLDSIGPNHFHSNLHALQYANDTILFCHAAKSLLNIIKFILYSFEMVSGLKINFKSQLVGLGLTSKESLECTTILVVRNLIS